jgi:hypothetical protein
VTSSGPSPVRGFIAAIFPSPSSRLRALRRCVARRPQALRTPPSRVPAAEPASHNRLYPSPYYPVFRSRMVMIGQARRRPERAPAFSPGVQRWPFGDGVGASR